MKLKIYLSENPSKELKITFYLPEMQLSLFNFSYLILISNYMFYFLCYTGFHNWIVILPQSLFQEKIYLSFWELFLTVCSICFVIHVFFFIKQSHSFTCIESMKLLSNTLSMCNFLCRIDDNVKIFNLLLDFPKC